MEKKEKYFSFNATIELVWRVLFISSYILLINWKCVNVLNLSSLLRGGKNQNSKAEKRSVLKAL